MIWKLFLVLLTLVVLISSVFMLTACYQDYELIEIDDAYEQGIIDYDDLRNIAYCFLNEYVDNIEEILGEDFIPIEIGELSKENEKAIQKSFQKQYKKNSNINVKKEYFEIERYCGVYNGYTAFTMDLDTRSGISSPAVLIEYTIEGVRFATGERLYLWKKK